MPRGGKELADRQVGVLKNADPSGRPHLTPVTENRAYEVKMLLGDRGSIGLVAAVCPAHAIGDDALEGWQPNPDECNIYDTLSSEEWIDMTKTSAFWDDLANDLEDPEFLREFVVESMRIATVDEVVNALDDAREAAGLSKAELARAIQVEPATIRRLFASEKSNPTLGRLAEVAAALGMRITIEPLPDEERTRVTEPLLAGRSSHPEGLARHLHRLRTHSKFPA